MIGAKYEVEQKFRVGQLDTVFDRLQQLGAEVGDVVEQVDSYFAHPSRDYAVTDESLRMRRVRGSNYLTYKGPKIDTTTKTRREIELTLPDGQEYAEDFAQLLMALGFSAVAEVNKERRTASLEWEGHQVEISLDEVAHVGQFVELELIADEKTLARAREVIAALAAQLQLDENERRSYLEMLLAG